MIGQIAAAIITWILDRLLGRSKSKGPQTAAEQKVQDYEDEQQRVQAASVARDRLDHDRMRSSDEQREAAARQPDPNSRD